MINHKPTSLRRLSSNHSGVSNTEFVREEVEIPNITVHLCNKDTNFNMDDGMLNVEYSIATSTVLPPPTSLIPTFVPVLTISRTFYGVMQEPITTFFSSQSTEKSLQ